MENKIEMYLSNFGDYHPNTFRIWQINLLSDYLKKIIDSKNRNDKDLFLSFQAVVTLDLINCWF